MSTVREARLAGAVVLVLMACAAVAAAALVTPWGTAFHHGPDAICADMTEPRVVREDAGRGGSGPGWPASDAVATLSYVPYGPRCTWTLSDGHTVAVGPGWAATGALVVAVTVALGALVQLLREVRRSRAEGER